MKNITVLAVGDVTAKAGFEFLLKTLPAYRRFNDIDFCIVNGENTNNTGITPENADALLSHGADVITLGNHTFGMKQIIPYLDSSNYILRPANIAPNAPGRGYGVFDTAFGTACVVNLIGRVNMAPADSPKLELERILKSPETASCKFRFVDFHAEATSEKLALAHSADGRITALWGTHTHVQTNDAMILPEGTGYITDLGMTGPINSVIGMRVDVSISRLFGDPTVRHEAADGPAKLEGALFEIDALSGRCIKAESVRLT